MFLLGILLFEWSVAISPSASTRRKARDQLLAVGIYRLWRTEVQVFYASISYERASWRISLMPRTRQSELLEEVSHDKEHRTRHSFPLRDATTYARARSSRSLGPRKKTDTNGNASDKEKAIVSHIKLLSLSRGSPLFLGILNSKYALDNGSLIGITPSAQLDCLKSASIT